MQADQQALVDERAKAKERVKQQKIEAAAEQKRFKEQQKEKLREIRAQMKVRPSSAACLFLPPIDDMHISPRMHARSHTLGLILMHSLLFAGRREGKQGSEEKIINLRSMHRRTQCKACAVFPIVSEKYS
jgi:hypothetical protein